MVETSPELFVPRTLGRTWGTRQYLGFGTYQNAYKFPSLLPK